MNKIFSLIIISPWLIANVFNLKVYRIPGTNYEIELPSDWKLCGSGENLVQFCDTNIWPNVSLATYSGQNAKQAFTKNIRLLQTQSNIKIYGNALINGVFWLDYSFNTSNGQNFRSFSIFKDIEDDKMLEIDYNFYGQNISGLILEKFRASLESLRKT